MSRRTDPTRRALTAALVWLPFAARAQGGKQSFVPVACVARVDCSFSGAPTVLQPVRSGLLRALVVSSAQRLPTLPDVVQQLAVEGAAPVPGTPQAFGELIRREIPRWAEVVKVGNLKPD